VNPLGIFESNGRESFLLHYDSLLSHDLDTLKNKISKLFAEIGTYVKKPVLNYFISFACNPIVQIKNVDCGGYVGYFFCDFIERWWSCLITIHALESIKTEYDSENVRASGGKVRIEIANLLER